MKDEVIEGLGKIPATCVSDAMDGLNNLAPTIKPLREEYKISGRAITVKMPIGDNMMVLKGIRAAKPGDVLVVDAKGSDYAAAAGDFVIGLAQTMGLAGVVIDGNIRDLNSIRAMNFPVFCKGSTLACSKKIGGGEINVPISCGGTTVNPGDVIVGDVDGVAVVPQQQGAAVLAAAKEKLEKDSIRAEAVLGNVEAAKRWIDGQFGS